MLAYMSLIGPHFKKHPRPAMSYSVVAVRKGVKPTANANRLVSNTLLYVNMKENVQLTKQSSFLVQKQCIIILTSVYLIAFNFVYMHLFIRHK